MQSPNNLKIAAHSRALAGTVYRLTAGFPAQERFGLTAQMRRAAVSVGSNIYEGCGRSGDREFLRFLHIAVGSLNELEFQARVATDLGMLGIDASSTLLEETLRARRMLLKLIGVIGARLGRGPSDR